MIVSTIRLSNTGDAFADDDARDSRFIVVGIWDVFQAESRGTVLKRPLDSQASLTSNEVYF